MYDQIGKLLVLAAILSLIFVFAALYISHSRLHKHSFFAFWAARTMDFFYKPFLAIHMFIYKNPDRLHEKMSILKNNAQRSKFQKSKNRIVLAPHCMRHP